MKKRFLSLLLCGVMLVGLLPTAVFAENSGSTAPAERNGIVLGSGGIQTDDMVYFGEYTENGVSYHVPWRALDTNGFFLSRYTLGSSLYYNPGESCYNDSVLRRVMDGFYNGDTTLFTNAERNAIKDTLLSGESIRKNEYLGEVGQDMNAHVFPLSLADVLGIGDGSPRLVAPAITDPDGEGRQWWTRTINRGTIYVNTDGEIYRTSFPDSSNYDVLPAFNMELSSVLFASAAVGGKADTAVDENLTAVTDYDDSAWKLTLKDSSRSFSADVNGQTSASAPAGGSVQIAYSGAQTGENEYVSAMLCDSNDNVLYYGNIAQSCASGTASVTIPAGLAVGDYTLKVFSEQCNGDKKTDYASDFVSIELTVMPVEQFTLTPGGTYYFDLSGESIPGTVNSSLPDISLHYVPFTYVGTVNAYKLTEAMITNEAYAQANRYDHSLFVADYVVTHSVSWDALNSVGLIFGKDYDGGNIAFSMRVPSQGSHSVGTGDSERGTPKSNEWDAILNKNNSYIKNWSGMYSWGQDTADDYTNNPRRDLRTIRGYRNVRYQEWCLPAGVETYLGCRPVLEVLNASTLGTDALKAVSLDLNGGTLGGSSDDIQIIVKNGSTFTAPASDGLNRPDGDTGNFFMWLGSNGKLYAPGDSVPTDVTALTVQWSAPAYTVTLNANGGMVLGNDIAEYTYGEGATLPTADDIVYTGYTFEGWYDNESLAGSPITEIGDTEMGNREYWANWTTATYTVTLNANGGMVLGNNIAEYTYGEGATLPTADDMDYTGYTFMGWYDNESLAGSPITEIGNTETGNKEYWAKWEATTYTVTLNAQGGMIADGKNVTEYTYGEGATLPTADDIVYTGYTFEGWYDNESLAGSPITEIGDTEMGNREYWARWDINTYIITFKPENDGLDIFITGHYGDPITAPTLIRDGYEFIGWDKEIPTTMPDEDMTFTAQWRDIAAPTGEIKIVENSWKAFFNDVTFGLFFKDTQTVTITATDNSGEEVTIEYLLSDRELIEQELEEMTFTSYTEPFGINPDNEYVVYAKLTDTSGNVAYLNTDGIVLDATVPEISGIENGKTYCAAQTVTVSDKYLGTVTVNGEAVTLDENNQFTLNPAEDVQTIVVTDKAGNETVFTVTVNDGHTGGKATCKDKAVCEVCGESYGEVDANNHTDLKHTDAKAATKTAEGNIEYWYCEDCGKYYKDSAATQEITKADTAIAKLENKDSDSNSNTKSDTPPQTGDNSDISLLWLALLLVSFFTVAAATVADKNKKHREN